MAVSLGYTQSISGLGVSTSWASTATNTIGHVLSETPVYLAGTPSTWTIAWLSNGNMTGSSFVFSAEPAAWTALSGTVNFTVYWLDVNSNQQGVYTVPMTATGSFPTRTWSPTAVAYAGTINTGSTAAPTNGITSSTGTTMTSLVIAPETTDAATAIPGSTSSPPLAQFFATGTRVGLIVLKDGASGKVPLLVGPYAGSVWTGTGSSPISTLATTGATNCLFSTADTSALAAISVGWMTT